MAARYPETVFGVLKVRHNSFRINCWSLWYRCLTNFGVLGATLRKGSSKEAQENKNIGKTRKTIVFVSRGGFLGALWGVWGAFGYLGGSSGDLGDVLGAP